MTLYIVYRYTARPKKKSHTLRKFRWTALNFDFGMHLPWNGFDKLMQCHNVYLHPELY